jgi:hypothetical protein
MISFLDPYNSVHEEGRNDQAVDWIFVGFLIFLCFMFGVGAMVGVWAMPLDGERCKEVDIELGEGLVQPGAT